LKTAAGLDDNEASLVTQLNTDWWKGIFLADVPQRIEQHLVQLYGEKLSSDLVKIAHHGAKKTTTNDLLMTAHPRVAIIGVSQRSPFGHPRREVLERLEKYGVTVLRTDLNGATGIRVRHRRVSTFAYVNETL
jgi:competence protein ComEC